MAFCRSWSLRTLPSSFLFLDVNHCDKYPSGCVCWRKCFRFRHFASLALLLLLVAPSFCASPPPSAKVLVLWFGDKDSPALTEFENGLRATLERGLNAPVWIYDESFDEGWLGQGSPYAKTLDRFLNDKYSLRGVDIVVTMGNYPLQYMQRKRKTLLPNAKLMYLSWQSPQPAVPDSTGMVWNSDLAATLDVALTQNPGTHHVLLVAGATMPDRAMAQIFLSTGRKYLTDKHKDVDIQILSPRTKDETFSTLATLPKDTITILTTYYGDSAGQGFVPSRILPALSKISNRPMYGWVDTFLGHGIVGGSLINIEAMGAAFGNVALRVLHGEKPETIPELRADFRKNEFDWQQLKRWGIGMDKVPADSRVINREYTLWEQYKWEIAVLVGLAVIGILLIFNLMRLIVAQRRHLKQMEYRNELETLVAQLAAVLINRPAGLVDTEIDQSFQKLLEFFELDRVSVFEVLAEGTQLRLLHTRTSAGITTPPPAIDLNQLPLNATQIRQGNPIVISSVRQPTEEVSELRDFLRVRGILSLAAFPLQREQKTFALMAFSAMRKEREWNPDLLRSLRTIADIYGSALERKRAEEAVSDGRNRLAGIVESAMDAIIAVDDQQSIVVFNPTAERIFGCSAKEVLGQHLDRFIPPRFRAQHEAHISHFGETGITNRAMGTLGALWALRASGEEFPIEASISQLENKGKKLFTVIVRDVTERERAQQGLKKSHELNASILQSLKNHLAVLDAKGTIIAATDRGPDVIAISGINLLQLHVGANYFEVCRAAVEAGDKEVATALEGVESVFDGRQDHFEIEYDFSSGSEQRWFLMSVTPLKSRDKGVVLSHEDITERKRHEQAMQEMGGRLIAAQEQERSRIARELHDDINQQLALLAIEMQQLEGFLSRDSVEGRQKVQELWQKTNAVATDIQHLSHQLHSAKLEHLGIIAAVRGLCVDFSAQHKIEAEFQFRNVQPGLDPAIALSLFRVAQESLHNVAKHSQAKKVRVELVGTDSEIVLRISDDGVGFVLDAPSGRSGLGMISMRERIRLVGGTMSVWSRPSLGTQVEAVVSFPSGAFAGKRVSVFPGSKVG